MSLSTHFEVFDFLMAGKSMRIEGPPVTLDTLKAYLRSMGVESELTREGYRVVLNIRHGADPGYVQQLLDEWAE